MLVGIIGGIIWELREKNPVVDLKMLKDRNFAVATIAMFFLGFVLYASTVLIPQMLQELLGYTAQLSGMALSPGGAVIMFMMPVVGFLVAKVDTRLLVTFGCIVSASALFVMAGWDLQLDYRHAVTARMLQSFGLAFLFIPINVSAFAYVPKEKMNMGTGMINLARNIGASVGIATVTTMLQRRTQYHQSQLMEHVNSLSVAYHNAIAGTQIEVGGGGIDGGACDGASAGNDLRNGATAGGDAGVHRQLQIAGRGFLCGDSGAAAVEEAERQGRRAMCRCIDVMWM